jgi:hypothetical protein
MRTTLRFLFENAFFIVMILLGAAALVCLIVSFYQPDTPLNRTCQALRDYAGQGNQQAQVELIKEGCNP